VTGDLEHPIVRPNVSALPASTLKWIVESLVQTPRTLGSAIVDRVGAAWNGMKRLVGAGEAE
jgi:hypothetical protein